MLTHLTLEIGKATQALMRWVLYSGLPSHPHTLGKGQWSSGPSGVMHSAPAIAPAPTGFPRAPSASIGAGRI